MIATALTLFLFSLFSSLWITRWTRVAEALPMIEPETDFTASKPLPRVSMILPVRNEEDNIRECLESLLKQEYPNLEIVVVDDRSSDRTPEILKQMQKDHLRSCSEKTGSGIRLKVIQGRPCPPDWMGKNHALDQGYQEAEGDFLLFLDADTRAHPRMVEKAVGYAVKSDTGLLTMLHSCEFQCFWDSVVNSLILYLAPFQDIERFNDPSDPKANANGPFMLFRRDAYEKIGGHRAIKGEVVEDLVIARKVKEARFRLTWAVAPKLLTSRPYPSLSDLRKGWGKVLFRCMELDPKLIKFNLLLPLFLILFSWLPWVVLPLVIIPGVLDWTGIERLVVGSLALTHILTTMGGLRFVKILFRLSPTYPWAYPLGAAALASVQWEACYRVLAGKKVAWKGREYREEKG